MKRYLIGISIFFGTACGGSDFASAPIATDIQTDGGAGTTVVPETGGSSGSGGTVVGSGGTAGIGETGGVAGVITSDSGVGGSITPEAGSGGSAGDPDSGPCIAKTCLTLSTEKGKKACGAAMWDGCGNYIDCTESWGDTCIRIDVHSTCGGSTIKLDNTGVGVVTIPGEAGWCGGNCIQDKNAACDSNTYPDGIRRAFHWTCIDVSVNAPPDAQNCKTVNGTSNPTKTWCCID